MLCGNALRRNLLLDGVLEEMCVFEVVLGQGFTSMGPAQVAFFTGVTM